MITQKALKIIELMGSFNTAESLQDKDNYLQEIVDISKEIQSKARLLGVVVDSLEVQE